MRGIRCVICDGFDCLSRDKQANSNAKSEGGCSICTQNGSHKSTAGTNGPPLQGAGAGNLICIWAFVHKTNIFSWFHVSEPRSGKFSWACAPRLSCRASAANISWAACEGLESFWDFFSAAFCSPAISLTFSGLMENNNQLANS